MFRDIKSQDKALRILTNAIDHDRISQSYLFYGPEGVGKFTTALYFGMAINCMAKSDKRPCGECISCHKFLEFSHPDLIYIFPTPNIKMTKDGELKSKSINEYQAYIENRKNTPWVKGYFTSSIEIRKESMEMLQSRLEFSQRESQYRICIIEDADEMNVQTANSFLKTLEEPPENTILILITSKIQALLPTIVSRCQLVYFQPLPNKTIEEILVSRYMIDKPIAKTYSKIANGNLEQAIRLTGDTKHESRNLMIAIIESALKSDDLYIINLTAGGKDKLKAELLHDVLLHISLWLNDIDVFFSGSKDVNNSDLLSLLVECSNRLQVNKINLLKSIEFIDDLHNKIDGNVNIQFIIINLYNHLKSLFSEQK